MAFKLTSYDVQSPQEVAYQVEPGFRLQLEERFAETVIPIVQGEVVIDAETIRQSAIEAAKEIAPPRVGVADMRQRDLQPDWRGIGYVDMNDSGRLGLEPDEEGVAATGYLAGCTGVAGFVISANGRADTLVSHYDPLFQSIRAQEGENPVCSQLWGLKACADEAGVPLSDIYCAVVYPASAGEDAARRPMSNHYLSQLRRTATELQRRGVRIEFMPYEGDGHTLAAGRYGGHEGIFADGVPVQFPGLPPAVEPEPVYLIDWGDD